MFDSNEDAPSTGDVVRRHYAFALRDEVPLPEGGWSMWLHGEACHADLGHPTDDPAHCSSADVCRFVAFTGSDPRFRDGMSNLSRVVSDLTRKRRTWRNRRGLSGWRGGRSLPAQRVVAVVGAAWGEGSTSAEHFDHCFSRLQACVRAMRQATQARTPNVTLQRVWPVYMILDEHRNGTFDARNLVVIETGFPETAPRPTPAQVEAAHRMLLGALNRNPVEMYLDFELEARRAADTDGDHVEAILKAAAAAEILLKHTAWLLSWEATVVLDSDPAPACATAGLLDRRPSGLISGVLSPRLGGNWASNTNRSPVGAWRHDIARKRNAVIHRGYRPTTYEADAAISAMDALESHVLDRLAAMGDQYPRTALILAHKDGLQRRGAFSAVASETWELDDLQGRLQEYLSWLDAQAADEFFD